MRTSCTAVQVLFVLLCGAGVWGHVDVCPRHRGLSEGLVRAENRIRTRALYRIDLRHALKGFTPNFVYRIRVQTTYRPSKFNDATLVAEALDPNCGFGRLIVDTDTLYSPQHCPDVVTTQEKEPMGRAFFTWEAPSCGCVHFRARVHSDSKYYLEDEDEVNGPLARTVCVRDEYNLNRVITTTTPKPEPPSREKQLEQLCEVSKKFTAEDVLKNKAFNTERHISISNSFERDRLELALEQRKMDTLACCDKGINKYECFGDIRRRRIDAFCGTGEPQIPFSKVRYDWIKQMEDECCWRLGEERYTCFNYTLFEEAMLKDRRMHESERKSVNPDDFDPVNDLIDYPVTEDTPEKMTIGDVENKENQKTETVESESQEKHVDNGNELVNESKHSVDVDKENTTDREPDRSVEEKVSEHSKKLNEDIIDSDGDKDDNNEDSEEEEKEVETDETEDTGSEHTEDEEDEDDDEDGNKKITSLESCCYSGISAGIQIGTEGVFDACFQAANRLKDIYVNWGERCDRRFVVCCMHVIYGMKNQKWSK